MGSKKFSLLKSNNENKDNSETLIQKRDELPIIDKEVIEFVIKNFHKPGVEIKEALLNLQVTLEKSIDFIEDRSNELIKSERNFNLSGEYRGNSIRLHEISMSILKYVEWMNELTSKFHTNEKISLDNNDDNNMLVSSEKIEIKNQSLYNSILCEDLTGKTPKSFKLYEFEEIVESWEDLSIKTADILIKNFKDNKNKNVDVEFRMPIEKKSPQNDFRDTIIEMLLEYKINPSIYSLKFN